MTTFVISLALLVAGASDVSIETLDGQRATGTLVELSDQSVMIETNGKKQSFPVASVAKILQNGAAAAKLARPSVWIVLADDTRLTATSFSIKGDQADVRLTTGERRQIPRRHIRNVRLKQQDDAVASQWKKILTIQAEADLLVIRKRDKIDFLEGVVGNVDSENVHFTFDGDVIPVKLPKVEGIVYHVRSADKIPEAKAIFYTADEARVPAVKWTLSDKGTLTVTTPLGLTIAQPISTIRRADLTAGKLVFLSDLEPTSSKWTPYIGGGEELPLLEMMFRPRSDRAMDGGPLRLGGREHRKGLSIHSRTELVYDLKSKYQRFKTLAGIDDRTRDRGNVDVTIKADGKVIFTGTFAGKDEPRELDLDMTKVRRLSILVDYGKDLDIADHMNFIDARVLK